MLALWIPWLVVYARGWRLRARAAPCCEETAWSLHRGSPPSVSHTLAGDACAHAQRLVGEGRSVVLALWTPAQRAVYASEWHLRPRAAPGGVRAQRVVLALWIPA